MGSIQVARDVFGWQWREDWQAWCPPGWPERGDFTTAYLQRSEVLRQHGGVRTGAEIDQWGRPVIPAYQYNTEDTEILWQWVQRCPVLGHVRFQFPALRVLCVIARGEAQQVEGSGTSRGGALCPGLALLLDTLQGRGMDHNCTVENEINFFVVYHLL